MKIKLLMILFLFYGGLGTLFAQRVITGAVTDKVDGTPIPSLISPKDLNVAEKTAKTILQQQKVIKGTITDEQGKSLPGVNVLIKGTNQGTVTDVNGKYTLSVASNATLVFSFMGYRKQDVSVAGKSIINVTMIEEAIRLKEVVAIGYGTVKKSDLTGSVGSVKIEAINSQTVQNPLMALTGVTSGVQVLQESGQPGSSFGVNIRGANSIMGGNNPLYVIDGFPITGNLVNLNPNNIESMTILKDASATAIYGSRGANGVILITTKQGAVGKTLIEYDSYFGVQNVTKNIDMLNAKEFATLANVRAADDGGAPYFSESEIASFGKGTNWQDAIFRLASIQNNTLRISGGNIKTRFNFSANYFNQEGIIINSSFKRYQLKMDIEHHINANWKFSIHNILSRNISNNLLSDNTTRGSGVLSGALDSPPTLPVYDKNGNYSNVRAYPFSPDVLQNPVLLAKEIKDQITKNSDLSNLSIEGKFLNNFTFRSSLGIQYYSTRTDYYSSTLNNITYNGNARISYGDFTNILNENTLTYFKKFGENQALTILGGLTEQKTTSQNVTAATNGFLNNIVEDYNLASGSAIQTPSSDYSSYSILSYLGRINYAYKDKYLFTASIRADGSSRFGVNNKWGYFPSAAVAWRVSQEDFWANLKKVVNELKIRVSWGITGNTAVSPYQSLSTLTFTTAVFDKNTYLGLAPGSTRPNPDLKWESTEQLDAGLDIGLLGNQLTFTLDYYYKKTYNLLAIVPLSTSSGYSSTLRNIGAVQNKGLEMSANFKLVQGLFKWSIGANISFNRNKVLKLSQGADIHTGFLHIPLNVPVSLIRVGSPMGVFYGYKEDGLTKDGNIKYVDTNGDGVINSLDKVVIGDPNPKFIFGINSFLSYKNFGLTLIITGVQGNDIFNFNKSNVADGFSFGINQISDVLGNYWTKENPNPNAKYPRISQYTRYEASDRYIEDGSYIKIQYVELSYTFKRFSSPFNNSQIYIGSQNLLTLTKYSWYSPEVNTMGAGASKGIDQSGYPMARTFMMGVRFKF